MVAVDEAEDVAAGFAPTVEDGAAVDVPDADFDFAFAVEPDGLDGAPASDRFGRSRAASSSMTSVSCSPPGSAGTPPRSTGADTAGRV
ncbi:hypothetical protein A4X17_09240 [Plantibacter sp. H53]|nr:hypothetical protein A4X17_09240 [Plantibacter sp. H53]